MTKRISALLLALVLICGSVICISAASSHPDRVCDYADLLTDSEEASLRQYVDEISTSHNCDVVVVTVDSIGSSTPMEAADNLYDYNGYGLGSDNSGILLLLVMDTRDWWITTAGFGIKACTDAGIDNIGDSIVSYLSSGNYYRAFHRFAEICDDYYTRAENGTPYDISSTSNTNFVMFNFVWVIMAVVIAVVVAFIAVSIMKGQLKSVRFQSAASDYLTHDSLRLTEQSDLFLYSHVSRVARPKESSSSSGGSSTHHSSCGTSHGGGGGKF